MMLSSSTRDKIDRLIQDRMETIGTLSLSLAITDREQLLHAAGYGAVSLGAGGPVTPETLFLIGSISKTLTAVSVLQACEDGLMTPDTPVTDVLPWFRIKTCYEAPITIHHLLTHTAGLVTSTDYSPDPRGAVWGLRMLEAGCAPGEHFHYSEVGYQALGLALETVRDQPLAAIIKDRILEPLGMDQSAAAITHELRPWLAQGYRPLYDDRPFHPSQPRVPAPWLEFNSGDGCIASTATDMAKLARMLLNSGQGPAGPVISRQSYHQMIWEHEDEYGYGLYTFDHRGSTVIGHAGDMPGYEAYMFLDLDDGVGVVLLCTQPYPTRLIWQLFYALVEVAQGDLPISLEPHPSPLEITNAHEYAGDYVAEGRHLTLEADGERLFLHWGDDRIPLERRDRDRFVINHPEWDRFLLDLRRQVQPDGERPVVEAIFGPDWYTNSRYAGPRSFDAPEAWNGYTGHYRSHSPWQSTFRVILRKGKLWLIWPSGDEELLDPLDESTFRVGESRFTPERLSFDQMVGGEALRATRSGLHYYRFFTP